METIATRIIKVVNANGGNKSEFARKIKVTPAYISKLDKQPDRIPSDLIILTICNEFNVSERWLRTGEGEMYRNRSKDEELIQLMGDALSGNDDFKRSLLSVLLRMGPKEWELVEKKAWELVKEMKSAAPKSTEAAEEFKLDVPIMNNELLPEEAEDLERIRQEMIAKRAQTGQRSALPNVNAG